MRNQIKGPKFAGFSRTFLLLAAVTGLWHWTQAEAAPGKSIRGEPGSAVRSAEINAGELGRAKPISTKQKAPKVIRPMTKRSGPMRAPTLKRSSTTRQTATAATQSLTAQAGNTPPLTASFPGLLDNGAVYYPDGQGAVGQNHLMVASDSEIRFQDRNGGGLQTITTDAFWSPAGVDNVYDVRLVYDPYGARWVMAAQSSPPGGPYRLLMGVSDTSDPMGDWSLYTVDVSAGGTRYPDGVNLGFTRDWITVQTDLRDATSYFFESSEIFVFDKAWAYAGNATANFTRFTLLAADDVNAQVPAVTFSTTADRQYLMTVWNGNDGDPLEPYGWLAIYYVEGPVGQETLTLPDANSLDGWVYLDRPWEDYSPIFSFLPQAGATNKFYPGDSRLQGVIYRNGSLWTTHTIFLPTNGATRAAAQFWEVLPNGGAPIQNGRVEDVNNFYHYAYPTIAVNRKNEVLLGYSRFSTDSYPGGYYSYHSELDVFSSLRPVSQLVGGEAPFAREDPGGTTYWGRYNSAAIDPVNDTDLWTLQQYAAQPQGTAGRWGLWWARVTPPVDLAVQITESPDPVLAGGLLTYSVLVTNMRIAYIDDVVLTNMLPAGVTFASATVSQGTWNYANGQVVCNLGRLGDRGYATLTLQVTPLSVGQITNRAVAWARGPEAAPANNVATAVTTVNPSADLRLSVVPSAGVVTVSNNLVYTVQIANAGPSTATGVYVTNTFPWGSIYVSAVPSFGTILKTNNHVIWNINLLNSNVTHTLSVTVRPTAGGWVTNRAVIRSTSSDPDVSNNLIYTYVRVNAPPSIQSLANRTIPEDGAVNDLAFTIGDRETPAANLVLSAESSNEAVVSTSNIIFGGSGSNRTVTITPLPDVWGPVTVSRTVTDSDGVASTRAFVLTVAAVNDPPTLDPVEDRAVDEDSGPQLVTLTGITGGPANESQGAISITATSSDPTVVPHPAISYVAGNPTGTLTFAPATNAVGTAVITVRVHDGGTSNNIALQSFTVTVDPVNDLPTLNPISDLSINEDAGLQTITLTGISGGPANEGQTPSLTVSNSNPALLRDVAVNYTSGSSGTLTFGTVTNAYGTALVTVTLSDGASSNNVVARTFEVTVNPVNDRPALDAVANVTVGENAGLQTVTLTGITSGAENEEQTVLVAASSSASGLLANLSVNYQSPSATGTLTFDVVPSAFGTNTITVTVRDDGTSNNVATRTFTVAVLPVNDAPTMDLIGDMILPEDAGLQTLVLTGISEGAANETAQSVTITAVSSEPLLVPNPTIGYTNNQQTAWLRFTPALNASGTAVITVTARDNGGTAVGGVDTTVRTFQVTIMPVNDPPTLGTINNITVLEDSGLATVNLTGIAAGANEIEPLAVNASTTASDLIRDLQVAYTSPENTAVLTFGTVSNAFGTATIQVAVVDAENTVTRNFNVTITPINDAPTLDQPADLTLEEDFDSHTVNLTGITGGAANEPQNTITITATSSSPAVVSAPVVSYTRPATTGSLVLNPVANASGTATITVRVTDGAASNNVTVRTFTVTVTAANDLPSIGDVPAQVTLEDVPVTVAFTVSDVETAASSLALNAMSFNEEVVGNSGFTFGGTGNNRTLTIRPLPDQYGSATIMIATEDADGGANSIFFELYVNPVNDAPRISAVGPQTCEQDSTMTLGFTVADLESSALGIAVTVSSGNQTLVPAGGLELTRNGGECTLRITPAAGRYGNANLTITANDNAGSNSIATLVFPLHVNGLPSIAPIADQTTPEDVPLTIPLTVSDPETPVTNMNVTIMSSNPALIPTNSILVSGTGSARTVTITPTLNDSGTATITLTIRDADGSSASTTFLMTVRAVNDAPSLSSIAPQTTQANTPIQVGFTVEDVETPATALVVAAQSSNQGLVPSGNIVCSGSGASRQVNITPSADQTGTTQISVTAVDTNGASTVTSFMLTVNGLNQLPTISTLPNLAINEDTMAGPLSFTIGDAGTPPANLTVSAWAENATLIPPANIVLAGTGPDRTLSLTPAVDQFGSSIVTIAVSDGTSTNTSTFLLTVNAVNDAPTLNAISDVAVAQGSGLQTVPLSGISAGPNESGQVLSITAVSSNQGVVPNPAVNYSSPNSTGTLTFTPAANASGSAVVTVRVNDGHSGNNLTTQTFTVTVSPMSAPPTISSVPAQVINEDGVLNLAITLADTDTPMYALTVTGSSSSTTLVPNANILIDGAGTTRNVTVLPAMNQTGTTLIILSVTDGTTSASTSFSLTVNPMNDAPTMDWKAPVFLAYNPGQQTVGLSGITSGAENESQTLVLSVANSRASFYFTEPTISYTNPNTTAVVTFRPKNATGVGSNVVTVTINDGGAINNILTQSFLIYCRPNNSVAPPIASGIANQTTPEDTRVGPINFAVRSAVVPANLLRLSGYSSNQKLLPNGNITFGGSGTNRNVTLLPATNEVGTARVTISVTDTNYGGTNISFNLTVNAAGDAPVVSGLANISVAEDTSSGLLPFTVRDAETPAGALTLSAFSANTTLIPNANIVLGGNGEERVLMLTSGTNQTGSTTVSVVASDGTLSGTNRFTVTVNGVNDAPAIAVIPDQRALEGIPLTVNFTVTDVDTALTSLSVTASSSNDALVPDANVVPGGTGGNRSVTITSLGQPGTSTITVNVSDGQGGTASRSFVLTVEPVNTLPTLAPIGNVVITRSNGVSSVTVPLTGIGSGSASENQVLNVTASSDNHVILPNPVVTYTSPGTTGSLRLNAMGISGGTALVTATVNDGQAPNNILTRTFTVTVNGCPSISNIPLQATPLDTPTGAVPFTVFDAETAASNLVVSASSRDTTLLPNANIELAGTGTNRTIQLTPAGGRSGSTTVDLVVRDAHGAAWTNSFVFYVYYMVGRPTMDPLAAQVLDEDFGQHELNLAGISSGTNNPQSLRITAESSAPAIVPAPVVSYTSGSATGRLTFSSLPDAYGTVTITLTLDPQAGAASVATRAFQLTINAVNDPPAIDTINDVTISAGSGLQSVPLTGIKAGPSNEGQSLTVTATSSNRGLLPDPAVVYTSPASSGSLTFTPVAGQTGIAVITVTVRDNGGVANGGVENAARSFTVTVNPPVVQARLRIDRGSGGNLIVAWPTNATGLMLQSRPNVDVSWNTVTATPVVRNGEYQVTVSAVGGASFYRLAPYVWQPALTIRPGNGVVTISWPTTGNYHLQSRSSLSNGIWANVAATPSVVNGENVLVLNATGLANFYRLSQ